MAGFDRSDRGNAGGGIQMSGNAEVEAFLDRYRAAFETFDASAIVDRFELPCQVTGDADEVGSTVVATRESWLRQVEQLLAAYRAIGVRSAAILDLQVSELTPRLAVAAVEWRLVDQTRRPIYDFKAAYTLGDFGAGLRIAAISHNETPRLRAAMARAGGAK